DEQMTNLLAVQKTVSERIAHALTLQFTAEQQRRLKKDYTSNREAFEAYMRGRFLYGKRSREAVTKGIGYFQQAIEIDPTYALAWAGLADCYLTLSLTYVVMGTPEQDDNLAK